MYINNYYNNIIKPSLISQNNIYNNFNLKNKYQNVIISLQFNTFKNEKSVKIIKLYNLLFFITKQKPFLKKIKFTYIKKQVLKSFFFLINLRKKNFNNFIFYIIHYYFYFFNMYYIKNLKYNFNLNNFTFYIDNIQSQLKNYEKLNIKSQFKIIFISNYNFNIFFKLLNNFQLLNIYNNKNALFTIKK